MASKAPQRLLKRNNQLFINPVVFNISVTKDRGNPTTLENSPSMRSVQSEAPPCMAYAPALSIGSPPATYCCISASAISRKKTFVVLARVSMSVPGAISLGAVLLGDVLGGTVFGEDVFVLGEDVFCAIVLGESVFGRTALGAIRLTAVVTSCMCPESSRNMRAASAWSIGLPRTSPFSTTIVSAPNT